MGDGFDEIYEEVSSIADDPIYNESKKIVNINQFLTSEFINVDSEYLLKQTAEIKNNVTNLYLKPDIEITFDVRNTPNQQYTYKVSPITALANLLSSSTTTLGSLFEKHGSLQFFNSLRDQRNYTNIVQTKKIPIKITRFELPYTPVEPVLGTAFLYHIEQKRIVSDAWYFVPNYSKMLLGMESITNESLECEFHIDPYQIDHSIVVLVVVLSHPITLNLSETIKNSYGDLLGPPKTKTPNFLKIDHAWSSFAWTYIEFKSISCAQKPFILPEPIILDETLVESKIAHKIIDAHQNKYKTFPFTIELSPSDNNKNVVRSINPKNLYPRLSIVNQLTIFLKSITLHPPKAMKCRNILISISILDKIGGKKLPIIRQRMNPTLYGEVEYSKISYHVKDALFDDIFFARLPYPLPPTTVFEFTIEHVQTQVNSCLSIGKATFPLFQKPTMFIADGNHSAYVTFDNFTKPSETSIVTFSTSLRSNLYTNNPELHLLSFLTGTEEVDICPILMSMDPSVMVENLHQILDIVIRQTAQSCQFTFDPFVVIQGKLQSFLQETKLEQFLAVHVRFFALKNCKTFPIPLHTQIYFAFIQFARKYNSGLIAISMMVDFFLGLITKSLVITNTREIGDGFDEFIEEWAALSKKMKYDAQKHISSIGVFISALFDIGFAADSARATVCILRHIPADLVAVMLESSLRPIYFFTSLRHFSKYLSTFNELLMHALRTKILMDIFSVINSVLEQLDWNSKLHCCEMLAPCLEKFDGRFVGPTEESIGLIGFLFLMVTHCSPSKTTIKICHFLLQRLDPTNLRNATFKNTATQEVPGLVRHRVMFKHARNASLENPHKKIIPPNSQAKVPQILIELSENFHKEALTVAKKALANKELIEGALGITHHILLYDITQLTVQTAANIIIEAVETDVDSFFNATEPPAVKILTSIFRQSNSMGTFEGPIQTLSNVLQAIYCEDLKRHGNNNRSSVVATRALDMLGMEEFGMPGITSMFGNLLESDNKAIKKLTETHQKLKGMISEYEARTTSQYRKAQLLLERAQILIDSPDAAVKALTELSLLHKEDKAYGEYCHIEFLIAALIGERLALLNPWATNFMESFKRFLPPIEGLENTPSLIADPPKIPGFCDSQYFAVSGVADIICDVIKIASEDDDQELGFQAIDMLWPGFEALRLYGPLARVFEQLADLFEAGISTFPDRFFRVTFVGPDFSYERGKSFVYRFKTLEHPCKLQQEVAAEYSAIIGRDSIPVFESDPQEEIHSDYIVFREVIRSSSNTFYYNEDNTRHFFQVKEHLPGFVRCSEVVKDGMTARLSPLSPHMEWLKRVRLLVKEAEANMEAFELEQVLRESLGAEMFGIAKMTKGEVNSNTQFSKELQLTVEVLEHALTVYMEAASKQKVMAKAEEFDAALQELRNMIPDYN